MLQKIIFTIISIVSIICIASTQSKTKEEPQIFFIGFIAITAILLFSKIKVIPQIFLHVLLGIIYYFTFFVLCMYLVDLIAPDRATGYLEDGRKVKFMDFTFVYVAFIAFILSLITTITYYRNRKKIELVKYEKYFVVLTLVLALVVFCIYEI